MKKLLVVGIIVLFIGMSFGSSTGKIDRAISTTTVYDGSLLGYVNVTSGNPIEGALVRVYFHESYEEDYSDSSGFYHVTNIPICYCLKNVTCSKENYKTEWELLSIVENTTHDFILTTDEEMLDNDIESVDNNEIEPLDDYKEIITFIDGTCNNVTKKGIYIKRNVTFQAGGTTWLEISGYYRPWNHFNEINVIYIHASIFIGVIFSHPGGTTYSILGIALGDIEWS